ncbi:MAG: hypothetical protein K5884_00270 [Ruminococcus sp.]|uniref:hypothetical protein n=1 Tax=uncultured Ruminococcus sp. TaxID=165186 RepID=UPI002624BDE0|nr:hypothetical protein [uncultured Ruminococcus sp.]MCR4861039.1 hypothetical protein [Ruminococcus sp.]
MKRLVKLLILLIVLEYAGSFVQEFRRAGASVKELKKRASGVNERIEEIVGDLGFEPAQNPSSA